MQINTSSGYGMYWEGICFHIQASSEQREPWSRIRVDAAAVCGGKAVGTAAAVTRSEEEVPTRTREHNI